MEGCSAAERRDRAKHLKTHRALSSAHRRRAALPAGVTCLTLADAAGIDLRLRTCLRLGPRRFLLRHPNAAAERQPYAAAVIAVDVTNVASMVLSAAFHILIANAIAFGRFHVTARPSRNELVRSKCKVIILSSSDNKRDIDKIVNNNHVIKFITKPLTEVALDEIKLNNI
jgi:hypothetical protein